MKWTEVTLPGGRIVRYTLNHVTLWPNRLQVRTGPDKWEDSPNLNLKNQVAKLHR